MLKSLIGKSTFFKTSPIKTAHHKFTCLKFFGLIPWCWSPWSGSRPQFLQNKHKFYRNLPALVIRAKCMATSMLKSVIEASIAAFHEFNVEVRNRSVTSHPNPVQCSSCRVEFAAPLQQLFCRDLLFIEEELMLSMNNLALPGNMAGGGGGGNRYILKTLKLRDSVRVVKGRPGKSREATWQLGDFPTKAI